MDCALINCLPTVAGRGAAAGSETTACAPVGTCRAGPSVKLAETVALGCLLSSQPPPLWFLLPLPGLKKKAAADPRSQNCLPPTPLKWWCVGRLVGGGVPSRHLLFSPAFIPCCFPSTSLECFLPPYMWCRDLACSVLAAQLKEENKLASSRHTYPEAGQRTSAMYRIPSMVCSEPLVSRSRPPQ